MKFRTFRFNQGFTFNITRLSAFINCVAEYPSSTTADVASYMGVNHPVCEGFRGWFFACGLGSVDHNRYQLSPIGLMIQQHDRYLHDIGTHWLLHYGLVTDHGFRAHMWYHSFNHTIVPDMVCAGELIAHHALEALAQPPANRMGPHNDAREVLRMYANPEGLGALGLFSSSGSGAQRRYTAHATAGPPDLIAASMLFDRWQRHIAGAGSVRLSALSRDPEWVGRVCLMTPTAVRSLIERLVSRGLIEFGDQSCDTVMRAYTGAPGELVRRYYTER